MRFIRYKREKQQINFLNCNELDKWVDTCQTRPTEFYDVCEDCCTSSIIEPISYWKADNVLVCGSELGSDYLSDHSYEKWIEYNKYDHSIISIDYRNGVPSCDCGYSDYEWKYGDRTICGYELGDGYDQTSTYQVWEYVNGCDPTDIQAIEYRNPQKSCECGYRTLTMRVSDPLETKCYEPTGDTDPSIGYTYAKYYQWSICPDDPSYDEKTGVEEWRLIGRTCECGWVQKAFIPTEEYYCGSEIGKTSTTKYQKYVGVNICPEDQSIIEYTGDYRYYSVESNSCDCGYDDKEWVFVSTGCSGTSSYELWNYIDKCANTVISSETRNVVANDCNCGAVNLTDWTYIGQVCGIELGDDYDKTYIYDKYVRYDTCDNSVYATEYRNGTYNEECAVIAIPGNIIFEHNGSGDYNVIYYDEDNGYDETKEIYVPSSPSLYSVAYGSIAPYYPKKILFEGSSITKLIEAPITSACTTLDNMFFNCYKLEEFNVNEIIEWDLSNVTDMGSMFRGCSDVTSVTLGNMVSQNITSMWGMFDGCTNLTSIDTENWDVSNVTDMSWIFSGCTSLTTLDLSTWDTRKLDDYGNHLAGARVEKLIYPKFGDFILGSGVIGTLVLDNWIPSGHTTTLASGFTSANVTDKVSANYVDFSNITNMNRMFAFVSASTIEFIGCNMSDVTNVSGMFRGTAYGCGASNIIIKDCDMSNVTDMGSMFMSNYDLTSCTLSNISINSDEVDCGNMFDGCSALTSLDLSGINVNENTIIEMSWAFNNCKKLTSLDLSGLNITTYFRTMFGGCSALQTIYARGCNEATISVIEDRLTAAGIRDQVTIITA